MDIEYDDLMRHHGNIIFDAAKETAGEIPLKLSVIAKKYKIPFEYLWRKFLIGDPGIRSPRLAPIFDLAISLYLLGNHPSYQSALTEAFPKEGITKAALKDMATWLDKDFRGSLRTIVMKETAKAGNIIAKAKKKSLNWGFDVALGTLYELSGIPYPGWGNLSTRQALIRETVADVL